MIGTALAAKADLIVSSDLALLSVNEYLGVRLVGVAQAALLIEGDLGR